MIKMEAGALIKQNFLKLWRYDCQHHRLGINFKVEVTVTKFFCPSQSIYRLKKACHGELDEECNLLTPDQVVDRIFELVDENGDGEFVIV